MSQSRWSKPQPEPGARKATAGIGADMNLSILRPSFDKHAAHPTVC